ncbi:gamma-glutamyltransferase family protein [Aquabacter spiritensis]|uniref:Gamma-glutamyltransferase 1 n=1 Tax=Aquabacter spiritensis TaxID=933073 RepID=A0A4R3LT78_9HYPH|nr:gamma-glutamyltransferase family protein [Aquabacter spiritensis]TCT03601.1 gamma-glutamyltransferase 1 [Aquabacter spiritensis]
MTSRVDAVIRHVEQLEAGHAGPKGIVVAPQPLAVEVGAHILREGGNAIDAALATAFAQGIVDPFMGGIGGFGCLCLHAAQAGKSVAIGFHGKAGSKARPDIFQADVVGQIHGHGERYEVKGAVNQVGHRSVVVPGTLAGFAAAHQAHGRLPWHVLFEPAIALARAGIALPGEVYDRWVAVPEPGHRSCWERVNATQACRDIFTRDGAFLPPGALLRQPDYAAVLERIAKVGAQDFYTGEIAAAIVEEFRRNNGLFDAEDMAAYRPTVGEPVTAEYRGYEVRTMPLPASGPQLAQMLDVLKHLPLGRIFARDPKLYVHLVARVILAGFADRARHYGDPQFTDPPLALLRSPDYVAQLLERVCGDDRIEVPGMTYREAPTTTNVCVLDSEGNALAMTHTLGSASGVVVPGLGFVFNNCMYQYNPMPGMPNSIAPGKSRMTGITPTLLLRDGQPRAAIGGLGGTRILTAVMHTLLNVVDLGMTPVEAVDAPRFHAEGPWLELEARLTPGMGDYLTGKGWNLRPSPRGYDRAFAIAHIALRHPDGRFAGGSDPRGGGGLALA